MSALNEIKKKTKLSLDEMYETQPKSVGKLEKHIDGNPEKKQPSQAVQMNPSEPLQDSTLHQNHNNSSDQEVDLAKIYPSEKIETHLEASKEVHPIKQINVFPSTKQQTQKISNYKMTFSLTEDIYKAFNDLYANRILRGCKTEKSELVCEAISWLIKMENS